MYRDKVGKWRWKRQSGNNRVVAASEQGFKRRKYAEKDAIEGVPDGQGFYLVVLFAE